MARQYTARSRCRGPSRQIDADAGGSTELFNPAQRPAWHGGILQSMELHTIKKTVAASWVALTLIVAIVAQVAWPLQFAIVALGVLPPLALPFCGTSRRKR
jgi:hypothetical protein